MVTRCVATILCLALAHQQCYANERVDSYSGSGRIAFSVAGHETDGDDTPRSNAAVQPQANIPELDELIESYNRSDPHEILNPFIRTTDSNAPSSYRDGSSSESADDRANAIDSSSLGEWVGSGSRGNQEWIPSRDRRRPMINDDDEFTPSPSPYSEENLDGETDSKRPNTIEFDVVTVKPQSLDGDDEDDATDTSNEATLTPSPVLTPTTTAPHTPAPTTRKPTVSATATATPKPPTATTTTKRPNGIEEDNVSASAGAKSSSSSDKEIVGVAASEKQTGDTGSSGSSVESATTESASSRYSMGAASILSIVGVIVGICVIISLFVLISRRKYDDDDDDDVLGYGGGKHSIIRISRRLSPTFLMNSLGPAMPGQPMEPEFGSISPQHIMVSNRGRRPTGAMPVDSPVFMGPPAPHDSRGSSTEGGPSPSAFDSTDDLSALDSRSSDGWSSVLESEFDEQRTASRCTRDTRFSNITFSQNYSEYNPSEVASDRHLNRNTAKTDRSTDPDPQEFFRISNPSDAAQEYDIDDDPVDTFSIMSFNVDRAKRANGTAASRDTSGSEFSDYRSTDQSYQSGRYTGDSHINF